MGTFIYPCSVRSISDGWQDHINRGSLGGIDHPCGMGTPIYAAAAGVVNVADSSTGGSGGRYISIDHGNRLQSQYLHLSRLLVSRGQRVEQGQQIALSGASAYGSEYGTGGPHLHWHAIQDGARVNPLNYIDGSASAGGNVTPVAPTEEEEIMGAAQEIREHTQAVANNLQAYVTQHTQAVANNLQAAVFEQVRRESRLRLFYNVDKKEWVAVSQHTGIIIGPTKDKAHVDAWVALQYIGPTEKDKPVHFSNAQIDVLLTHMANLRTQLGGK